MPARTRVDNRLPRSDVTCISANKSQVLLLYYTLTNILNVQKPTWIYSSFYSQRQRWGTASNHSAPYAVATNDFLISLVWEETLESARAADSQAQHTLAEPFTPEGELDKPFTLLN